ncbi:hypothetical protein JXB02_01150 [Candidatus Woesearchaeota archaeon]|nr:hypothetical protein [Candidatus Woesearchaeota archaeon]
MKKLLVFGLVLLATIAAVSAQAGSDCFYEHGYVGCDIPSIEACVCGMDSFCCQVAWDYWCVLEATDPLYCGGPFCGDGYIDQDWEQCDDGNNADGDGCSANCAIENGGEIPEFGTMGAALALLGAAGYVAIRKRK